MKRLAVGVGLFAAVVAFCFMNSRPALADGNVGINWSTPWGGEWMTPGTCGANNNVLQVSGTNCTVVNSTNVVIAGSLSETTSTASLSSATIQVPNLTATQILASTPTYTGQPVLCTNCAAGAVVCISTTVSSPGAGNDFVLSTGTACK